MTLQKPLSRGSRSGSSVKPAKTYKTFTAVVTPVGCMFATSQSRVSDRVAALGVPGLLQWPVVDDGDNFTIENLARFW
jgi:hypothetical protein